MLCKSYDRFGFDDTNFDLIVLHVKNDARDLIKMSLMEFMITFIYFSHPFWKVFVWYKWIALYSSLLYENIGLQINTKLHCCLHKKHEWVCEVILTGLQTTNMPFHLLAKISCCQISASLFIQQDKGKED